MTDAEFTRVVVLGMDQAADESVFAGPVAPPFPERRVVWHVTPGPARGTSRLVVNVFNGAHPFVYEQETVANGAPAATIRSAVGSMSERLMADVATEANTRNRADRQVAENQAGRTIRQRS
jgi:hypothetical protein